MKHIIPIFSAAFAALALSACGGGSSGNEDHSAGAADTAAASQPAALRGDGGKTAEAGAGPADSNYAHLAADVAAPWRPEEDTARDPFRHPAETLEFFGVDPSGAVAEVWPGRGYYTRILAPWIAANGGAYYAIHPADMTTGDGADERDAFAAAFADPVFGDIRNGSLTAESAGLLPEAGTLDAVLTFRNVHNWVGRGFDQKAFDDFYAALKPGGILGVVDHRLPAMQADIRASSGYVATDYVRSLASESGFEFVESSDINANPKDDADHPMGVWTLKPTRRSPKPGTPEAEGFDRAEYDAIGESDRMTLLFRKPEAAMPQAIETEDETAPDAGAE